MPGPVHLMGADATPRMLVPEADAPEQDEGEVANQAAPSPSDLRISRSWRTDVAKSDMGLLRSSERAR